MSLPWFSNKGQAIQIVSGLAFGAFAVFAAIKNNPDILTSLQPLLWAVAAAVSGGVAIVILYKVRYKLRDITQAACNAILERLKAHPGERRNKRADVSGLFFDYNAAISVSLYTKEKDAGWTCLVEFIGENNETEKEEVFAVAVNRSFETADAAIKYGKSLVKKFAVECVNVRVEEF